LAQWAGQDRGALHTGRRHRHDGPLVAEMMTALLGQQVIVENRGGGNTIIGS
jgi:hypothetical protein